MKKKEKKKDTKFHKTYGLASNLSYIVKEMLEIQFYKPTLFVRTLNIDTVTTYGNLSMPTMKPVSKLRLKKITQN